MAYVARISAEPADRAAFYNGALSHWKGLAYPNTAFGCTHAAFLAKRGATGPREVFEGKKGFMDAIVGRFQIDWSREDFERVNHPIVKKYNAEIHSQSALEAILELKASTGGLEAPITTIMSRSGIVLFPIQKSKVRGMVLAWPEWEEVILAE